jgi:hypothetical protein
VFILNPTVKCSPQTHRSPSDPKGGAETALTLNPQAVADNWIARLQFAVSLMGSAVSWVAWGLSVWVGMRDGVAAGVVFGVFSFAVNVLTLIELHRLKRHLLTAQVLSFVMMPVFAFQTLSALRLFSQ